MNFLTKTRFLVIVIIIETVLLVTILATFGYRYYSYKQDGREFRESRKEIPEQHRDFMAKALDLSPEQRDEFRMLKVKFHKAFDTLEVQIRDINKLLTEEVVKDEPNQQTIDSLIDEFGQVQQAQKRVMVEHLQEVKAKCTPEQKEKFNKFIRRMHDYQQNQFRKMERMRRGQNPRTNNNQN
ncbi:MAG: periplasmic heavy metal sensor [Bacteroidales bacterium]|nr:MAG: periplasmic heavy metal sensor [Bacteroidales bacterium]